MALKNMHFGLEFARFIAAVFVVLYHTVHLTSLEFLSSDLLLQKISSIFVHGHLGVQYFFVFSGYVLSLNYALSVQSRRLRFSQFLYRRILRLYPLHIAFLLLVFVGQLMNNVVSGNYFVFTNNTIYNFACHLSFIHWMAACGGFGFNAVSWSVGIELYLYVVFFIIFWCIRSHTNRYNILLIILLLISSKVHYSILTESLIYFLSGVCIHLLTLDVFDKKKFVIILMAIVTNFYISSTMISIVCYCGLILMLFGSLGKFNDIAKFLGSLSYPLYMSHFMAQVVSVMFATILHVDNEYGLIVVYCANLILWTYLAYLIDNVRKKWAG